MEVSLTENTWIELLVWAPWLHELSDHAYLNSLD